MTPTDILKHVGKRVELGLRPDREYVWVSVCGRIEDLSPDASSIILRDVETVTQTFESPDDEIGKKNIVKSEKVSVLLSKIEVLDATIDRRPQQRPEPYR
jgi:hypothetical protein